MRPRLVGSVLIALGAVTSGCSGGILGSTTCHCVFKDGHIADVETASQINCTEYARENTDRYNSCTEVSGDIMGPSTPIEVRLDQMTRNAFSPPSGPPTVRLPGRR